MRRSTVWLVAVVAALSVVVVGTIVVAPVLFLPDASASRTPGAPAPELTRAPVTHRSTPAATRPATRPGPQRPPAAVRCALPQRRPVRDGAPIVVEAAPGHRVTVGRVDPALWTRPPVPGAQGELAFYGLGWLLPAAQRAAADGQKKALARVVDQVVAFHRQHPDHGRSDAGWDEGTAMRRLQAVTCLYELTRSPRLLPAIRANVAVQFGPRYYGPPRAEVHNHGVMANLAVLKVALLLGNRQWRDRAVARLGSEARAAWTARGTTLEQSSTYHAFNVTLWTRVARALEQTRAGARSAATVRALVDRASGVLAWMTEPDGRLVVVGDAEAQPGRRWPTARGRVFRDDEAGLAVGRWSWRDPSTSYYTLRYGGPRRAHGQEDRGGVTWSALGVRVLVNPGRFTYDVSPLQRYQAGPRSHNVAVLDGRTIAPGATVTVTRQNIGGNVHRWGLKDRQFGTQHARGVMIDDGRRTLTVADRFPAGTRFRQMWHLDPRWTLAGGSADGRRLTFRSGARTLTVTTTGAFAPVVRGGTSPIGGWNFPAGGKRTPNAELQVVATGAATTTFVLQ